VLWGAVALGLADTRDRSLRRAEGVKPHRLSAISTSGMSSPLSCRMQHRGRRLAPLGHSGRYQADPDTRLPVGAVVGAAPALRGDCTVQSHRVLVERARCPDDYPSPRLHGVGALGSSGRNRTPKSNTESRFRFSTRLWWVWQLKRVAVVEVAPHGERCRPHRGVARPRGPTGRGTVRDADPSDRERSGPVAFGRFADVHGHGMFAGEGAVFDAGSRQGTDPPD